MNDYFQKTLIELQEELQLEMSDVDII